MAFMDTFINAENPVSRWLNAAMQIFRPADNTVAAEAAALAQDVTSASQVTASDEIQAYGKRILRAATGKMDMETAYTFTSHLTEGMEALLSEDARAAGGLAENYPGRAMVDISREMMLIQETLGSLPSRDASGHYYTAAEVHGALSEARLVYEMKQDIDFSEIPDTVRQVTSESLNQLSAAQKGQFQHLERQNWQKAVIDNAASHSPFASR